MKTRIRKRLGQHYLTDENICRKIVDAFDVEEEDYILEIGPGRGEITKYLTGKSQNYIAIELDRENCLLLKEKFPGIKLLNQDILEVDFTELSGGQKIRVIGNIPYNITSQILFTLFDNRSLISDALLMMQEEVARRLTAKPGTKDYGITSIFTQVFTRPKMLFQVSRNCFYPKPRVDSMMISFEFGNETERKIDDIEFFRTFVRTAFGKRRKTLKNALKDIGIETKDLDSVFDFGRRAESLSVEEFIRLSNYFLAVPAADRQGTRRTNREERKENHE